MVRYISLILLFSVSFSQEIIGEGLSGQSLLDYVVNNYKTSTTLGYSTARDTLYGTIDLQEGNQLSCVYSGYTITLDTTQDPSTDAYNKGINCEHTFPQSMGAGEEPQKSDMHHLFPCKSNVNSSRGNNPYAEIPDEDTDTWYRNDYSQNTIPTEYIEEYAEKNNPPDPTDQTFEPREDHKGDVSRAVFYFFAMYNDVADTNFWNEQRDVLLDWHYYDEVDEWEMNRTWSIASYQENQPNPFVLDSSLARRIWDSTTDTSSFGQVDYLTQIQTIFNNNCTSCHINGGAYYGGLDLSTYDSLMAGSNNGAVVVAGDHTNSLLWQKVNSGEMPPQNNPDLTSDDVSLIAQWIDEGALNTPTADCTANGGTQGVELWGECYSIAETDSLDLSDSSLTGEIPHEIGNLTNLTFLELSQNQLTGEIPTEIGNLINLKWLSLWENQLAGNIPESIWGLILLENLDLGANQLAGSIPPEIGNLINLKSLFLDNSQFTGEIPSEIGNLVNLRWLVLSGNELTGEIPFEIWNLTNLRALYLSNNQFTGSIHSEIGNMAHLQRIVVHSNQFTDPIPSEIGNLTNLVRLKMHSNQLTGPIPETLCNLSNLTWSLEDSSYSVSTLYGNQLCYPYPSCVEDFVGEQDISECVSQTVWHVSTTGSDSTGDGSEDNSFATIQKGIDTASDGDTVLVAAGTYVENIRIYSKNIVVLGEDREITIIDGNQLGPVVLLESGDDSMDETLIDSTSHFSGFTIQNGYYTNYGAGGINCKSKPKLSDLIITENTSLHTGGGIYLGGRDDSFGIIYDVIITGNSSHYGSGVFIASDNWNLLNVRVENNTTNVAEAGSVIRGGGIYINECSPKLENVIISGNSVYINISTDTYGGGVYIKESSPIFMNVVIFENSSQYGGGIYSSDESNPVFTNTIFWGNWIQSEVIDGPASISYSNIQGGYEGEGNIEADPKFCNPDSGDYTLAENSPCVGTGENGADMGAFSIGCEAILSTNNDVIPLKYTLHQNYPNPFNPITTLRYDLPEDALVSITIYDMVGRVVKTMVNSQQNAGFKSVRWNASNDKGSPVSAGLYLYTIQAGEFRQTKKMILLK